ncbi:MAG: hypothetical protein ACTSQY_10120 [Candidatus Odinarchaeia archaeon]
MEERDKWSEFDTECKRCDARSIAIIELEKYLLNNFNLKKIHAGSPPEKYLCMVRYTRRKHGQYLPVCKEFGGKNREDIEECINKLKPTKLLEFNGIFYLL